MGRRSPYDELLKVFTAQLAAGKRIDVSAGARAVGCGRPTASRLYTRGLKATPHSAGQRPLRELLGAPASADAPNADEQLLQDVRSAFSTVTSHAIRLLDGVAPGVARARATLAEGSDLILVLDTCDRLAKVVNTLVNGLDKLAAVSKIFGGRKPAPTRAPAAPPPDVPEDDAKVRARLDAVAKTLGEGVEESEDEPEGYGREIGS